MCLFFAGQACVSQKMVEIPAAILVIVIVALLKAGPICDGFMPGSRLLNIYLAWPPTVCSSDREGINVCADTHGCNTAPQPHSIHKKEKGHPWEYIVMLWLSCQEKSMVTLSLQLLLLFQ